MSITLRRPSDAQPDPAETDSGARGAKRSARPAPSTKKEELAVGAEPRVDLLPPEVRVERRNQRTRRGFTGGVLAVLVAVILAIVGAFSMDVMAQARLAGARLQTQSLLGQQLKYSGVRDVQKQVALAQAAQQTGASTEISWKPFLDRIGAAQPAGVALKSVSVDSASPLAIYQQSQDPLQGPRVGTVTVVASSASLPDLPAWASALQTIDGVVDVVPGTVNWDPVEGRYVATVTIHVGDTLYTKRFETKEK